MASDSKPAPVQSAEQESWYQRLQNSGRVGIIGEKLQPLIGLVLITLVFMILAPSYRQWPAIRDILEQSTVMLIMATGTTIVLLSGNLDLSTGSLLALVAVVTGSILLAGMPVWLAVIVGLLVGALGGFINGVIVIKTGVPTLIVTLGTLMAYRGLANMIGAGKDMSRFPDAFKVLGGGFVGPFAITVVSVVVMWFILAKTRLGFNAYAIGGNSEVARLSGVNINRNKVIYYSIGGLMAGLAAIVQTSRLDFAHPNRGQAMELWVIAATVIGGTSMFGGVGGIGGTIIGVLIIKSLQTGLIHLHVPSFWQQVAIGAVIILAVWLDILQRKRASS
ncbi:MAG: ABC transporter permease [Chloroflexi bacterium]|nr:ABC transporter permease [Chloroflexota bacterium]